MWGASPSERGFAAASVEQLGVDSSIERRPESEWQGSMWPDRAAPMCQPLLQVDATLAQSAAHSWDGGAP
jgi:hypothetical protein